jgi:hypothetical protein
LLLRLSGLHHRGRQGEVFLDCQVGEDVASFDAVSETSTSDDVGRLARDTLAVEGDGAREGRDHAADGSGDRGLAGAVGAQQGNDFPSFYGEGHVGEGAEVAVARRYAVHGKKGRL